jgi:hypothetical protein
MPAPKQNAWQNAVTRQNALPALGRMPAVMLLLTLLLRITGPCITRRDLQNASGEMLWGVECTLFEPLRQPASEATRSTKLGTPADQLVSANSPPLSSNASSGRVVRAGELGGTAVKSSTPSRVKVYFLLPSFFCFGFCSFALHKR